MSWNTFESIFYDRILPNSAAGAVFILLILAFRLLTRRWSKGYVRILWILLLVCLLAPPLFRGSFYTVRNLGMDRQAAAADTADSRMDIQTAGDLQKESLLVNHSPEQNKKSSVQSGQEGKAESGSSNVRSDTQWSRTSVLDAIKIWSVKIWAMGACLLALIYLYQYVRLRKKMSDAVYVYSQEYQSTGRIVPKKISGAALASVHGYWISGQTDVPFVMPGLKPRIYLPQGIGDIQMADILAHERQHIKNLDPLVKCLASAALAVYWFHPLVWLAVSLMGKDMEMYCDECVLRGKGIEERKAYSGTLLEYAAQSSGLTFTMHFGESNTGNRIRHILRVKKPCMIVSVLLAVFIGISGVLFLTSGDVEAEKQTAQAGTSVKETGNTGAADTSDINNTNDNQDPAGHEDFREDPYKFAQEIIRLVEEEKKDELARLISFPIRVDVDGDETYVQNKMEFVEIYDQIANEQWKSGVLHADVSQMISNYMGYGMGSGKIWFAEVIGQEGYWIYAINNAQEPHNYDQSADAEDYEQSIQNGWQELAAEHGMTAQEAKKWYRRFRQDDLEIGKNNMRVTGCAYEDFDGNGEKDLFLVASIMPNEIYPESVQFTMYVYGYMNGGLSYQSGSSEFSKDGFLQCEAEPVSENGIGCRIRYTVDTDRLEEQPHLLDFDTQGNFIRKQLPGESEKYIRMLKKIPYEEYDHALDFETLLKQIMNSEDGNRPNDQMVSVYENKAEDLHLYSYFRKKDGARGAVIRYKGTYSYFDMDILGEYGYAKPFVYFTDIDKDSEAELVCTYSNGHGTGMLIGGLTVFDLQQDHTVSGYELKEEDQLQQVGSFIHFDRTQGKVQIRKDGKTKKEIDLTASPEYEENKDTVEINYSNWYGFEMEDGRIKLKVEILGVIGFLWYMDGVENTLTEFDVLFKDGKFYIDYI